MKRSGAAWFAPYMLVLFVGVESAEAQLSAAEQRLLQKLVLAEARSEGELGMALVARSTLNRTALVQNRRLPPGTYNARGRTLRDVVMARGQYQPVSDGSLYARRTASQHAQARRAIALARDTDALRRRLRQAGKSPAQIERLLAATGFRTGTAFRDRSQSYARETFGNHVFNGDRFSVNLDVQAEFERLFAEPQPVARAAAGRRDSGADRQGMTDVLGRLSGP